MGMKIAQAIALLGALAMGGIIAYAFIAGDFGAEGAKLLGMPWGVVSLVDLYTGFILFSCWIALREKSPWVTAAWVVLMMTLGFFTASVYTFIALRRSGGDWKKAMLGWRAG